MTFGQFAIAAATAAALGALSTAAPAAPLSGAMGVTTPTSVVEKAAYRCRWRQGQRVCRWVPNGTFYGYSTTYDFAALARSAASAAPTP